MGAAVDARDANFSDSISSKRQAYRSKDKNQRRRRRRDDGTEEVGDLSDSEDESVERRLARLRREVEELRVEMENQSSSGQNERLETSTGQAAPAADKSGENTLGDGVAELSRALDNLHASSRVGPAASYSASAALTRKLDTTSQRTTVSGNDAPKQQPATGQSAVTPVPSQTGGLSTGILSHAAAFEGRLALLEASMGISSSSNPFVGDAISEPALQPVLPALEQMTSRLSALTSLLLGANPASGGPSVVPGLTTPHLESLSARVRKLTTDAEALASARKRAADAAKAAQAARIAPGSDADGALGLEGSGAMDDEQIAKIQALYATLPTIQSLHPLLPSVLERLRSLRACHADAAHAAESLNELEKRHAEMASEITQWREGLAAVEERMKEGEVAMRSNVETLEPWVRDLESRMARLEGPPGGL